MEKGRKEEKEEKKKIIKSFVQKEVCFSVLLHLILKVLVFSMSNLNCQRGSLANTRG